MRRRIPWGRVPLLFPVLALCGGILASRALGFGYVSLFGGLGLVTLSVVIALLFHRQPGRLVPALSSVLLLLTVFLAGGAYAGWRHPLNQSNHFSYHEPKEGPSLLVGRIVTIRPGEKRLSLELKILSVGDTLRKKTTGKLLAYLPPDERAAALSVGQTILAEAAVQRVPPPLNPEVFDYAGYLANQNIFHRLYLNDPGSWTLLDGRANSLMAYAENTRNAWLNSLRPYLAGNNLAVAAALIMGKRDLLDSEVKSAYADTGAIHVLAVSGLHVGILALIVAQLLRLIFPPRRIFFLLRSGVTVIVVWYFALLVGLSPSVQRAALMVSVVLLGKALGRSNHIFNLLAIAALMMLLADPKQLFQVGFQLSFTAVSGIALFARWLDRLVYAPGLLLRRVWSAISVSTGAQLGTLPLSLFYFRQFPVFFMISGTLVVVFAYLALGLGLLHGFLAGLGLTGWWLWPTGNLLNGVIEVQNAFIFYCSRLPGATLRLTHFGAFSALGLASLIGGGAYLIFRPSHRVRWGVLVVSALLFGSWALYPRPRPDPPQFTIYHLRRATLIDVFDGQSGQAVGDSLAATQLEYSVLPLRNRLDYTPGPALPLTAKDTVAGLVAVSFPLVQLADTRILVLAGGQPAVPEVPDGVDLILVSNSFKPKDFPLLSGDLPPVVIDGSNPPYLFDAWRERVATVHITAEQGAYRHFFSRGGVAGKAN